MHRGHARFPELAREDGREVEVPLAATAVVAGERRVHLLADLVAAAARARADQRGHRAVAAASRSAATPSATMPAAAPRQPAWSAATAPSRPAAPEAIGREDERGMAAQRGRLAVLLDRRPLRPGRLGRAPDGRAVHLAPVEEALARAAGRGATRTRFSSTLAPSSSVSRPRLSEANGPVDTPPRRVVNSARAPGRPAAMCSPSQWKARAALGASRWPSTPMLGAGRLQAGGDLCLARGCATVEHRLGGGVQRGADRRPARARRRRSRRR